MQEILFESCWYYSHLCLGVKGTKWAMISGWEGWHTVSALSVRVRIGDCGHLWAHESVWGRKGSVWCCPVTQHGQVSWCWECSIIQIWYLFIKESMMVQWLSRSPHLARRFQVQTLHPRETFLWRVYMFSLKVPARISSHCPKTNRLGQVTTLKLQIFECEWLLALQ